MNWIAGLEPVIRTINDILTAGIAITAMALLLFAISFNLRDRVVRTFLAIIICVVIVFTAEALGNIASAPADAELWLRMQWVGIILMPAIYLHFSDAILFTTGKPSRGRRRWAVRLSYLVSFGFLVLLPTDLFVGHIVTTRPPAYHLAPTVLTSIFTFYYLAIMAFTWYNFIRAYRRTVTSTSRRRMGYLLVGATAPALGSYPFLLFGSELAAENTLFFWAIAVMTNLLVGVLIIVMAYAVSFFGVAWPDRVVKGRLLKWMLRGPFTASLALGLTTILRRAGEMFGATYNALVPIAMAGSILLLEYLITLLGPWMERHLFSGNDLSDIELVRNLEDRLITRNDLRQFLEMILAAVCDHLQTPGAYIFAAHDDRLDQIVKVGKTLSLNQEELSQVYGVWLENPVEATYQKKGKTVYIPIHDGDQEEELLLGVLVVCGVEKEQLDRDQMKALDLLISRASLALRDRLTQEQVFRSLEALSPQVELIQDLRAAARYDRPNALTETLSTDSEEVSQWVRDALTHYWGGPRLTENPLLEFQVIKSQIARNDDSAVNALRAILKEAIEHLKPDGDRKYTSEWILYNIVEMKFLEGKKVRDIANRLSMSEADLYRKQRVAIDAVAGEILQMEEQCRSNSER